MTLAVSAGRRAALQAAAAREPARPRLPLRWRGAAFGSIEPELLAHPAWQEQLSLDPVLAGSLFASGDGWHMQGDDFSASARRMAGALRAAGLAHVWRNELLAVEDEAGRTLGALERGVCRVLGIATQAVHLAAWSADGRFWVQQRAFDKPTDPGLWDTLVGGMVPAGESLASALERETWEEAGLRPTQLQALAYGGVVELRHPAAEVAHGYVRERLHWYRAVLAPGAEPANQDGEVAAFDCLPAEEVASRIERDAFTRDAALVLLAACG